MRPSFFVTTPIFYVNDVPHIGHAYTVIAADALARYKRMTGHDVFFLTGTDEHGQKIEKAAAAKGEAPKAMADRLAARFATLWRRLDISHDRFIRTTEAAHERAVHALFERLKAAGDVYLGEYEGWYCVPDESFWTELQLVNGRCCPDCGREVEKVTEPSYFFRMSRYGPDLLAHLDAHPDFVLPPWRANEVARFVEGGLRDLSISRTGVRWGIPLPDDPDHVVYVWLDALANYLTATGFPEPGYERRWPAQVHIIGKDILRFHAVYWPTFLRSAGLPLPERIVAHGWWTIAGEKMSKSRGNVVDPAEVADRFGVDALRYFVLREVPFGRDGDFSLEALVARTNTDLANDLGNLLSRTVSMVHRYLGGTVPAPRAPDEAADAPLIAAVEALPGRVEAAMATLQFDRALAAVWEVVGEANRFVDRCAPWGLARDGRTDRLGHVLYVALEAQRVAGLFLHPFMPGTARRMGAALGVPADPENLDLAAAAAWGGLAPGTALPDPAPLFPRVEADAASASPNREKTVSETASDEYISIHDFTKVRLKVGTVTAAEAIQKADKLLKLQVDIGGGETRQVVAGIARNFAPEDLVGRQVVVVTNLRPAKLMGVESQGMILAAGDKEVQALLGPGVPVPPGTVIR